jgi:nucleoside-diphosphate-sugar epimerase
LVLHLVTGGCGYFGSLLVKRLYSRGYKCRVLDINPPFDLPDGAEFIQGDIRDEKLVLDACADVNVIHHNVAQVPLAKDVHQFESVNIGGMENILRAAKQQNVGKLIYTSSSAVFGVPKTLPVTEETEPSPAESYGIAKASAEKLCKEYVQKGLDISIVRPRTILGHGRLGIFQILFEWVSEGRRIPVMGRGDNVYQFVHADDLAEVCIRAGEKSGSTVFNCGADRFGTMRQLLQGLCDHAGTGAQVSSIPKKLTVWGMKATSRLGLSPLADYHWLMYGESMYFDTAKIKNELGWTPVYSNEEMICQSYDWYLANKSNISQAGRGKSIHRSAVKQGILKVLKWVS